MPANLSHIETGKQKMLFSYFLPNWSDSYRCNPQGAAGPKMGPSAASGTATSMDARGRGRDPSITPRKPHG